MSLEVYLRACQAVYRALGRKVGQCVGHVDAMDTRDRPRQCNRWMNPERLHSRQSSQRLRTIEIRHMAKIDTSPIRTNYSHRSTR